MPPVCTTRFKASEQGCRKPWKRISVHLFLLQVPSHDREKLEKKRQMLPSVQDGRYPRLQASKCFQKPSNGIRLSVRLRILLSEFPFISLLHDKVLRVPTRSYLSSKHLFEKLNGGIQSSRVEALEKPQTGLD